MIIRASLLLLTGGFAAQHNRVLLSSDLHLLLFVATLVLFLTRRCRPVALVILGFLIFMQAGQQVSGARLNAHFEGDSMLTQVRIVDFPKVSNAAATLLIEPVDDHRLPARSRVSWFEPAEVPGLGEIWELELRLRRPRGNSNPGVFQLEDWMFRERIHASGYVVPGKRNRLLQPAEGSATDRFRQDFVDFASPIGGESAAVIAAIGIGTRHLLSSDQWDRYGRTGTSHLMAISGLHIGLAATAAFVTLALLSGSLRLRGNHLDRAVAGAALVAAGYALVCGFAVPSQRATLMLALAALAFVRRRRQDSPRIVALVAIAVFLLDPVSILRPGFSLSFGAVAVLLWVSRVRRHQTGGTHRLTRVWNALRQLTGMQFVLLFGLIPLTTVHFSRIAMLAPLVNLLAVPVFSLVTVPLTLVALSAYRWIPAVAELAVRIAAVSVLAIEKVIAFFASLPLSNLSIAMSGIHWFVVWLPALWVLLPRSWPGRWLAIVALLALLTYRPSTPMRSCFDLHVLDVGQGLAVVVQTRTRTLLFDTGAAYRGGGGAAEQVVLPFLAHRGIDVIDWLVVSHSDNDHAGGVAAVLPVVHPGGVFVGERLPNVDARLCEAGYQWAADGVTFRFQHPAATSRRGGNDASCVLSISSGAHRLLLTGDIELAGERDVLQRDDTDSVDIVLIPHHGSLTSSSMAFVARLQPRLAIASAGHGNRWGFPRQEVVGRWEDRGAQVFDTAASGAISASVCARDGIQRLRRNREEALRFWHDATSM